MPHISIIKIILLSALFSWLVIVLLCFLFRFPMPLSGYTEYPLTLRLSIGQGTFSWLFYGVLFGGIWGSAAISFLLAKILVNYLPITQLSVAKVIIIPTLLTSLIWPLVLANLDLIIGPW